MSMNNNINIYHNYNNHKLKVWGLKSGVWGLEFWTIWEFIHFCVNFPYGRG